VIYRNGLQTRTEEEFIGFIEVLFPDFSELRDSE